VITKLFRVFSVKDFMLGTGATLLVTAIGRPLLVSTVRGSLGLASFASDTWNEAVAETQKIKQEAIAMKAKDQASSTSISDIAAEIQKLRADVAAIKGQTQTA
jgi:hypothetical protein